MMFVQARRDFRSALHAWIASVNPQLDEARVRERVDVMAEYSPQEPTLARAEAWSADRPLERSRALGGRLWIVRPPDDPWLAAAGAQLIRETLPDAHVEEVDEGTFTRPDLAATVVRRASGVER
jgi:hypothetical protein